MGIINKTNQALSAGPWITHQPNADLPKRHFPDQGPPYQQSLRQTGLMPDILEGCSSACILLTLGLLEFRFPQLAKSATL